MKFTLALLMLAAATFLGGGVSCSDNSSAQDANTLTILWAEWEPANALQKLGDEYKAATGVTVNVVKKPWSSDGFPAAKQKEFNTNGTAYDIIVGDSQWLGQGVVGGHYAEVTDLISANPDLFKDVAPAALAFYAEYPKGSKKYYAVPCESDAMAIAYRKDLFDDPKHKEGYTAFVKKVWEKRAQDNPNIDMNPPSTELGELAVPKTWDHLLLISRYFKEAAGLPNMAGIVMPTTGGYDQASMSFECMLWAFGGDWGDQTAKTVTIDSPQSIEALRFMKQLVDTSTKQGPNMDYGEVVQAYTNGHSAMAMTYFAFMPSFNSPTDNKEYAAKTGYFNVPAGPTGKRFTSLGGQGMSMNAHISDARKARTRDFMKWFSKPETQQKWVALGGFSANTAVLASDTFKAAAPYNALFPEAFAMMRDFWNIPEYDQLLTAAQSNISQCLQGEKKPDAAIKDMQSAQERVMKKAAAK